MKSTIAKTAALAALMSGSAGAAYATEGWYGRADAGWGFEGSVELEAGGEGIIEGDLDDGWMGSIGFGKGFAEGFRLEGELAYRQNDIEDSDSEASSTAAMANAYYDFHRGGSFQPYVGVGAGYGKLEVEDVPFVGDTDEDGFAWQAMAGVGIALSEQATLDIGYRYFNMPSVEVGEVFGENEEPVELELDYEHHAATVGLRWQFAAPAAPPPPPPAEELPPPPPPPAPAACPTADFVVYFEWDRSNLNQAALETIDTAVNQARACNLETVVVIGHTDTSGSAAYNVGLGQRRASVVHDALVARGMSSAGIRTESHGETDLAKATPDGVREPLNRRTAVTITFRP
jgi:outer membrane protein OmpA-like peptidoglycan-associated protein